VRFITTLTTYLPGTSCVSRQTLPWPLQSLKSPDYPETLGCSGVDDHTREHRSHPNQRYRVEYNGTDYLYNSDHGLEHLWIRARYRYQAPVNDTMDRTQDSPWHRLILKSMATRLLVLPS
jgi:hypothetical protein